MKIRVQRTQDTLLNGNQIKKISKVWLMDLWDLGRCIIIAD